MKLPIISFYLSIYTMFYCIWPFAFPVCFHAVLVLKRSLFSFPHSDRLEPSRTVFFQPERVMNESYEAMCPDMTRQRANTWSNTTERRTRPAEFSPDAADCVTVQRVPSPPELFDFNLSKCFKSGVDFEEPQPGADGLSDFIDLDCDLDPSLFGDDPTAAGASCSYLSVPIGSPGGGGQKKKRRNPWGPETYAELISKAIESRPDRRATLQQIYKFIIGSNKFFRDRSEGSLSAGWKVRTFSNRAPSVIPSNNN